MRPYSKKERSIIISLLEAEKETFTLIDFIKEQWPIGAFEISTFQQSVRVFLQDKARLDEVMSHLVDVLAIIKHLEYRGYLSSWDSFPMEDNTEVCGEKEDGQEPYFLSDLSVASDLLRLGNKKFTLSYGLEALAKRNFKSTTAKRQSQLIRTLIVGFLILALIGLGDIYSNYSMIERGIKVNLTKLQNENAEVLKNQELNQIIIDSLYQQSRQLLILTTQISRNTENIREIENAVKHQNVRINQLRNRNLRQYELSTKNHQILMKTDSLLNKIPLN